MSAAERLYDWAADRHDARMRVVRASCAKRGRPTECDYPCPGDYAEATPFWRVLFRRTNAPVLWCDYLDADVRYRVWQTIRYWALGRMS